MKYLLTLLFVIIVSFMFAQNIDTVPNSYNDDDTLVTISQDTTAFHNAVQPDQLENTIDYQSEKINVKKFDSEKWKKIIASEDYQEKAVKKSNTNMPRINVPWASNVLRAIFFLLVIGLIALFIYYILKNTTIESKFNKKVFHANDFVNAVENIADLDMSTLLQQALEDGNLRLAVRIYYLGLLKKLNENGFILWKKNKTNRDYLSELFSQNLFFDDVKKLTISYEEVWYGEHTLTRNSYENLMDNFESVYKKIGKPESV